MKAYNSYSNTMFLARDMRAAVAHLVNAMPGLMREYGFDTIVVTGKSGTALGFAVAMLVPGLHIVSVRKGESSHGDMVEGDGHSFDRYAFFDDFIASGATMRRVHDELTNYCTARSYAVPQRVLNIGYAAGVDSCANDEMSRTYFGEMYYRMNTQLADAEFHIRTAWREAA